MTGSGENVFGSSLVEVLSEFDTFATVDGMAAPPSLSNSENDPTKAYTFGSSASVSALFCVPEKASSAPSITSLRPFTPPSELA